MFSAPKFDVTKDFILPKNVTFPKDVENKIMLDYWLNTYERLVEKTDEKIVTFDMLCLLQIQASNRIWDASHAISIMDHNNTIPEEPFIGEFDPERLRLRMIMESNEGKKLQLSSEKSNVREEIRLLVEERESVQKLIAKFVRLTGEFGECKKRILKIKACGRRESLE
jgi:hypothetical protein